MKIMNIEVNFEHDGKTYKAVMWEEGRKSGIIQISKWDDNKPFKGRNIRTWWLLLSATKDEVLDELKNMGIDTSKFPKFID